MEKTKETKKFKVKETKYFWSYWIIAAFVLALGVFLLPVWGESAVFWKNWATEGMAIILFVLIALYMISLFKKTKQNNGKVKSKLTYAELFLLVVIALFCLLEQFDVTNFVGPCFVLGAVIWLRATNKALNICLISSDKSNKSIMAMLCCLLAVTASSMLMISSFSTPVFSWIVAIVLVVISLCMIAFGFLSMPKKENTAQQTA